jgi:hypothetical protein
MMSRHVDPATIPKPRHRALILLFATFASMILIGCSKSSDAAKTSELQPRPISMPSLPAVAQSTPAPAKDVPSPKTEDVNEALVRVFNKAVTLDSNYASPVLIGDFNGDGFEDIAIALKPNPESLAEINGEFANWALEDVKQTEQAAKPTPVKAERTDTLIAIIHGVGAKGWRDPEARQAFLLRNAAGTKPVVEAAEKPSSSKTSRNSASRSDVIRETIGGHRGLIYWNGARYALRLSSE